MNCSEKSHCKFISVLGVIICRTLWELCGIYTGNQICLGVKIPTQTISKPASIQGTVGQIRGDEAHFRFCEFGTPSGHFGPKLTAWDRLGLFRTILERYGPFLSILDRF